MAAYTWNREEQMFIALGKEFDMVNKLHFYMKLKSFRDEKQKFKCLDYLFSRGPLVFSLNF